MIAMASKLIHVAQALVCVSLTTAYLTEESSLLPGRVNLYTQNYDAFYDFSPVNRTHESEGISVVEPFTYMGCMTRGVLKISLSGVNGAMHRRRVMLDLLFTYPSGWTFNLGDSSSNEGSGGDSGTSVNDAEVVANHGFVSGYLNEAAGNRRAFRVPDMFSTRLTLIVGDGHVAWFPDQLHSSNYFYSPDFFALNGQPDSEGGINHDIYLGINKVIKTGSPRTGAGLCYVGIKYLPEPEQ